MEYYRPWHEPTDNQIESGNYKKRKLRWHGLVLRIENEAGSVRRGVDRDGKSWENRMVDPYGYVCESEGVDGDEVDVFVGGYPDARSVYVVHARTCGDWSKYDEDKVFLDYDSIDSARAAFLQNYNDARFLGTITTMSVPEFIEKVRKTKRNPKMIKCLLWHLK